MRLKINNSDNHNKQYNTIQGILSDKLISHILKQDQNSTGNSIYKKKTRHERYHDRVYLFIYEKIAHPLMYRKRKNNKSSDQ